MVEKVNDGGPAFPVVAENGMGHIAAGMTMRDWFAGQALVGIADHFSAKEDTRIATMKVISSFCYEYADAMLAQREQSK